MGVTSSSDGCLASFRQKIYSFAQKSIHDPVDIHRLAEPQTSCFIVGLLEGFEQVAKAVDVGGAVHGGCFPLTSPSPWSRNQALLGVNPRCDVRHWRKS